MKNHRFLLVDDHSIVTNGINSLLTSKYLNCKVTALSSENKVYSCLRNEKYDLAILDLNLGGKYCFDLISHSREICPSMKILILTSYPETSFAIRMYKLGVQGYINKAEDLSKLLNAIDKILKDRIYYSEITEELLRNEISEKKGRHSIDVLSNRELQVALLLKDGAMLKDIEKSLYISKSTASTYKKRIFDKLNVGNVIELSDLFLNHSIT